MARTGVTRIWKRMKFWRQRGKDSLTLKLAVDTTNGSGVFTDLSYRACCFGTDGVDTIAN